jgi:hypothetical protein
VNGGLEDASAHFTLHGGEIQPACVDRSFHTNVG